MRMLHADRMRALCGRALSMGGVQVSATRVVWDISGNCRDPYCREVVGRPEAKERWRDALNRVLTNPSDFEDGLAFGPNATGDAWETKPRIRRRRLKMVTIGPGRESTLVLELWTRCRMCDPCRASRARMWRERALSETRFWQRTWFGTLTLRPDAHALALIKVRHGLDAQGIDYDALPFGEQFVLRADETAKDLTDYVKRCRKNSGAPLRYLLVAEAHKSGLPHYHMLIHECDPARPVRYAVLRDAWRLGFTQFKLTESPEKAVYLCKYLAKSSVARVRASLHYGDPLRIAAMLREPLTPEKTTAFEAVASTREGGLTAERKSVF